MIFLKAPLIHSPKVVVPIFIFLVAVRWGRRNSLTSFRECFVPAVAVAVAVAVAAAVPVPAAPPPADVPACSNAGCALFLVVGSAQFRA